MILAVVGFLLLLTLLQWVSLIRKQREKRFEASQYKMKCYVGIDEYEEQLHTEAN